MSKMKCIMSWSGGKDSALALYRCLSGNSLNVAGLVTTINQTTQRISMHGVSLKLLKKQAESIGIPLHVITLPDNCTMDDYERIMGDFMVSMKESGVEGVVFGDIFLEDIKRYREKQLAKIGLKPIFPLWGTKSTDIAKEFLANQFKSIVTCVDGELLDSSFVGKHYSSMFITNLPDNVDVCGENGEFHSFVFDGPIFTKPVKFDLGEKIKVEYPNSKGDGVKPFWFIELASK
ncbi:Dph6-related ATP pyrophosphatase [Tenuifilum thalassicum]|uniref:Diphthine--ammonia ligase n=1 Tax=Tenuifilum thalassicum TaxID=2590900 RepID=A0A7D4C953_9BACT|nr:diphthine--ammonia ligase [Tenuifilum thalassicum]QKG80042.1 diphthine--ammonia ligase [Tenuifilum thalassicum]